MREKLKIFLFFADCSSKYFRNKNRCRENTQYLSQKYREKILYVDEKVDALNPDKK